MSDPCLSSSSVSSWSVRNRLLACFALVLGLLLALSAYSVNVTRGIDDALSANSQQNTVIQRAAIDFRGSVHDRSIALRDAVYAPGPAAHAEVLNDIERLRKNYADAAQRLQQVLQAAGDRVPVQVHVLLKGIQEQERKTMAMSESVLSQLRAGEEGAASERLWGKPGRYMSPGWLRLTS